MVQRINNRTLIMLKLNVTDIGIVTMFPSTLL